MQPMSLTYVKLFFLLRPLFETIYWFNGFNGIKVKLAKSNILLMAMVKVLQGCSTVQKYKRKKIQTWKWSLVEISVSQTGDKSEIINLFELRKVAGRVGGMGWAAWFHSVLFSKPRVAIFHSVLLSNQIQPKDGPLLLWLMDYFYLDCFSTNFLIKYLVV